MLYWSSNIHLLYSFIRHVLCLEQVCIQKLLGVCTQGLELETSGVVHLPRQSGILCSLHETHVWTNSVLVLCSNSSSCKDGVRSRVITPQCPVCGNQHICMKVCISLCKFFKNQHKYVSIKTKNWIFQHV